jgi:PII-like signaling protein
MERFLWTCLAGAAGTGTRYLIAVWAAQRFGSAFPYGTHTPLARALLERLRAEGFAGATVMHGVAGFGANSVSHTASLIELSTDLAVVIEVVDDQAHVDRLIPILDQMITGGALVTVERVRVLEYSASNKARAERSD